MNPIKTLNPYKPVRLQSIHCNRMTTGLLIGLLAATQGSVALGAIRWGEAVLRQRPQWYNSAEARAVADSVIQYQSPQRGWPKSTNLATPPRTPDDIPPPGRGRANSLDNEATTLPMAFLARVAYATGESKYRASFVRGVDYLLAAQYPNGGWPQFWPLRDGYYSRITYNDGAMIRVMTILRDVASGQPPYDFVGAPHRAPCRQTKTQAVQTPKPAQKPDARGPAQKRTPPFSSCHLILTPLILLHRVPQSLGQLAEVWFLDATDLRGYHTGSWVLLLVTGCWADTLPPGIGVTGRIPAMWTAV